MIAIDTNVFIYTFDRDDPRKHEIACDLVERSREPDSGALLPWQVTVEYLRYLRKRFLKKELTRDQVRSTFQRTVNLFPIVIPATSVLDRSFHLDVHFSLSHWDATLLAACREAGVTRLDSEDLSHGTDYDGVVVVNPFLAKN